MIEPENLRALTLVAATGSVAAAAVDLSLTPSAVSQQVKRLEASVGVPLLARAGRGVVLTAAGEALIASAPAVFDAMDQALQAARAQVSQASGTLRVAAFSTAIRGLLSPVLPELRSRHPELDLAITEADPAGAVHAVSTGAADLAIVHDADGIPTPVPGSLRSRHIHTDSGDVVVPIGHRLARLPYVDAAALADQSWVTSPPGTACYDWFRRLFDEPNRALIRHSVDDFSTQLALVAGDDVIALIPRLARPPLPEGLVAIPVRPAPTRRVDAAWRASSDASPAIRAVISALAGDETPPRPEADAPG